jgi:hypothetical protein
MIYNSAKHCLDDPSKKILFFGMSGLGKSYISNMLRENGDWFHYSVDYRIGTRYMGEHIVDNCLYHAMKNPFLAEMLLSDSIYIANNITDINLAPLSAYLGKPGNNAKGGLAFAEYAHRQKQHQKAEVDAMMDTEHFINRSKRIYGYPHFVTDTGGSICEVVNPDDRNDPLLKQLSKTHLMIWIEGTADHTAELVRRFDKAPKPMCYQPQFLADAWATFLSDNNISESEVNPDDFIRWTYVRAMEHRQPLYAAMAKNWGIKIKADDLAQAKSSDDVIQLIARTLGNSND